MRLRESGGREDLEDLARVRDDLSARRQHLFLRCLVIAAALLVLIATLAALLLQRPPGPNPAP